MRKYQRRNILIAVALCILMIWIYSSGFFSYPFHKSTDNIEVNMVFHSNVPSVNLKRVLKAPNPFTPADNPDKTYSQAGQDVKVYEIFPKTEGFFIEMGALDGFHLSNTLWMERKHRWTGLLIEANPDLCKLIEKYKRHAWRLCACISDAKTKYAKFIKGEAVGALFDKVDKFHVQQLNTSDTVTVPCFTMKEVLDTINVHHIDYFSLDVEGAELFVLESMRDQLMSGEIIVDVWTIEYRVYTGKEIIWEKGVQNLKKLRKFFSEIGRYVEHSQISYEKTKLPDGHTLDVAFVYIETWCKTNKKLPNGKPCPESHIKEKKSESQKNNIQEEKSRTGYDIKNYLIQPFPPQTVNNTDKKYSQARQDEVVYKILNMEAGFFVEIGALDGMRFSNTLWLERKHKWSGLLIEANPHLCKRIDALKRHAWRLCACLSSTEITASFILGDAVGGVADHVDQHHMKMLNRTNSVVVPCFSMEKVLSEIKVHHINFFSLDVEGAELAVLESMKNELASRKLIVDVWSIEYRVWDGTRIVIDKSTENLNKLRDFFKTIGGYFEHSQLSNDANYGDGKALDVVFVYKETWCKSHNDFPDKTPCSEKTIDPSVKKSEDVSEKKTEVKKNEPFKPSFSLKENLLPPHPYTRVSDIEKKYSHAHQDETAYSIFPKSNGFFIEMGAHDGEFGSNTLWLERKHNWTGLLVEANPELCVKLDALKRRAWRLCGCISKTSEMVFIKGNAVGALEDQVDEHHIKLLDDREKVTIPCFALQKVLKQLKVHTIDYFSLDVEGAELFVLQTLVKDLETRNIVVNVWTIEYRVWDGKEIIHKKGVENLDALRNFFNTIGGYVEHSQISYEKGKLPDGHTLDVVFVNVEAFCRTHDKLPNGTACPKSLSNAKYNLKDFLIQPNLYQQVNNTDKKYAQVGQDQLVYDILKKDNGFFVDIGANDGQFVSNTLWLERKHSWTGLLIEADPDLCEKIDLLKRRAWRLCACISDTMSSASFIQGGGVGGVEDHIDEHHIKMLDKRRKVTVPCFSSEQVLDEIKVHHIDFYSLDVEGAEMAILNSMKSELKSRKMTVDVWSIEYRVWDGRRIVVEKSKENLEALRTFFKSIGGYVEHSQLYTESQKEDGYALDVVFVSNKIWCKTHDKLPDNTECKSS